MTIRRWMVRWLGLVGTVSAVVCLFTPLPNLFARRLAVSPLLSAGDAIVVLGAGLQEDGTLEPRSLCGTVHGIALYRRGLAPVLVFCGSRYRGYREGEVRASLAREMGIAAEAIWTETNSLTTREEAMHVAALSRPRGIRRILLVTNSLHMTRAKRLFERSGFEVFPAPADVHSLDAKSPEGRLELVRQIAGEVTALLYYRIAGYL